jgi:hypothetical protein
MRVELAGHAPVLPPLRSSGRRHWQSTTTRHRSYAIDDDLILEAAIASYSDFIITFNRRDSPESTRFGIRCLTSQEFLILLKEKP